MFSWDWLRPMNIWMANMTEKRRRHMDKNNKCSKMLLVVATLSLAALIPLQALGANKLIVRDSGGTVDKFVVTDTGALGVGFNAPKTAVHVEGSSTFNIYDPTSQVRVHSTWSGIGTPPAAFSGGGFLGLHNQPISGGNPNGYPLAGDRLGYFLFGSQNLDGTDLSAAGFSAFAKGDWSATSTPSYLTFETTDVTSGRKARLIISPNGNVGIGMGQNTPNQVLEVVGGVKIGNLFPGNPARNPVKPNCDKDADRGTFWFTNGVAGDDKIEICMHISGAYGWKTLAFAP